MVKFSAITSTALRPMCRFQQTMPRLSAHSQRLCFPYWRSLLLVVPHILSSNWLGSSAIWEPLVFRSIINKTQSTSNQAILRNAVEPHTQTKEKQRKECQSSELGIDYEEFYDRFSWTVGFFPRFLYSAPLFIFEPSVTRRHVLDLPRIKKKRKSPVLLPIHSMIIDLSAGSCLAQYVLPREHCISFSLAATVTALDKMGVLVYWFVCSFLKWQCVRASI